MTPIYSQNIGLCGFRCRVGACTKVVRSYRGIVMHVKRVHGLGAQMEYGGRDRYCTRCPGDEPGEPKRWRSDGAA